MHKIFNEIDWIRSHVEAIEVEAHLIVDGASIPIYGGYGVIADFYRHAVIMSGVELLQRFCPDMFSVEELNEFHTIATEIVYTMTTRSFDYITEKIVDRKAFISNEDTDTLIRLEAPLNITPMTLFLWAKGKESDAASDATRITLASLQLDAEESSQKAIQSEFSAIRSTLAKQREKKRFASLPAPLKRLSHRPKEN